MKYDLPSPSGYTIVMQCFLVLIFAVGLYYFIGALQTKKNYEAAISQLNQNQQHLNWASQQVAQYKDLVENEAFFQQHTAEPQWESVDETWVALSYNKLLQRLTDLYRPDRPFVLDFFSANIKSDQTDSSKATTDNAMSVNKTEEKLVFHLQGYFLCPCR